MSSNQLLVELLELSQGVSQFQNLQLLNIEQSSSLFNFAPELLDFVQGCGNSLNELEQFTSSPVSSLLLNLNSQGNSCLEQLIQLEQLFLGQSSDSEDLNLDDSNDDNSNLDLSNSTDISNSTVSSGSADLSNSTDSASNASANAAPVAVAQQAGGKADAKNEKKEGKRSEIVQRSGASKRQVLTGLGLAAMMVAGVFAL
ncbi:hypothetical protein EG329_000191 [Mollisiaceae sp. DMI_Dod_QoI]|nr:hypothetical protein EG329_000191 [Helotiales sp. DMI_Dod_QoI]